MKVQAFAVMFTACALFGCQLPQTAEKPKDSTPKDQSLPITLGGFIENHPEQGTLDGVCATDVARTVLNCDIHNGLEEWTVTELTLGVTWSPYNDDDKRYYRETVSIEPMKTSHVSIRLGLQLPPDDTINWRNRPPTTTQHWAWLVAGARALRFTAIR